MNAGIDFISSVNRKIILLCLFSVPLAFSLVDDTPFIIPKIFLIQLTALLILTTQIIRYFINPKPVNIFTVVTQLSKHSKIFIALWNYIFSLFLATLFSIKGLNHWNGTYRNWGDGLITTLAYAIIVITLAQLMFNDTAGKNNTRPPPAILNTRFLNQIIKTIILVSFVAVFYSLVQSGGTDPLAIFFSLSVALTMNFSTWCLT